MEAAIIREKAIIEWKRAWKMRSVGEPNPEWHDLYEELA
jgi:putative endonuclease